MWRKILTSIGAFALTIYCLNVSAQAMDKATVRLDWIPTAAHAFIFLAKEKGYYTDAGIDLEIIPGDGDATVVKLLGNDSIDFGLNDAAGLVRAWEVGIPITSVHVQFMQTPATIFASKASGVTKIQDVCGKKFGVYPQSTTYAQAKAMLKAANVTCTLDEVPVSIPGIREFMSGSVDLLHSYYFNAPVYKLRGFDVVHFDVKQYFNLYSQVIGASAKAMKRGDLAQRFVRASLKGLEDNIKDPKEALAALGRAAQSVNLEYEAAKMPMLIDLMTVEGPGGVRQIEKQNLKRWIETIDHLQQFGIVKTKIDPKGRFVE